MPDPVISVITPNFNGSPFLERTLRSVLDQGYPALEYIAVDGGSTDGSIETLRRYEKQLAHWGSEPDHGHYDAVNKGFGHSTGEILTWLNSDDMLLPGSLHIVAQLFREFPDVDWITGIPAQWDAEDRLVQVAERVPVYGQKPLRRGEHDARILPGVQQEGCFWRRALWEKVGGQIDTRWTLGGDFELWTRMARHAGLATVSTVLAGSRRHPKQRSAREKAEYFRQVDEIAAAAGARQYLRTGWPTRLRRLPGGRRLYRCFLPGTGTVLTWEGDPDYRWVRRSVPLL